MDSACREIVVALLRDLAAEVTTPGTALNNATVRGVTQYLGNKRATTADLGQPLADELDARATAMEVAP